MFKYSLLFVLYFLLGPTLFMIRYDFSLFYHFIDIEVLSLLMLIKHYLRSLKMSRGQNALPL